MDIESKVCNKCKQLLPLTGFTTHKQTRDGRAGDCKKCRNEASLLRYPNRAASNKERHLQRSYKLTSEQYEGILEAQGGVCPVCKKPPKGRMVVDHDHDCCPGKKTCGECVRGILHVPCNAGLAVYEEYGTNLDVYLSKYRSTQQQERQ